MPERPASVPAEAFWSEDENEWCLPERDDQGEYHGWVQWWRPDGTLCCKTEYQHGAPHGVFRRFHENGEVSREGRFEQGRLHGTNVFYRSSAKTTEKFPQGLGEAVKRAEMDYRMGDIVAARCYDEQDRQCMEDGAPFPERPKNVPADAHFRKREQDGEYRWVVGSVVDHQDGTIARIGTWRFYTPEGVLVAEENYKDGKLHGLAKYFSPESGEPTEEITCVEGKKRGPRCRPLEQDESEPLQVKAVSERGEFEDDAPLGVVEYLDGAGKVLARIDTGLPEDLEATQQVLGAGGGFADLAGALLRERKTGAWLFALGRGVGRGETDAEKLRGALAGLARPWSDHATFHVTQYAKMVVSNMVRFGAGPDKCLNQVFEGIRRGGFGTELLRFGAGVLDDMGESRLALELVDAAIAAAPAEEAPLHEYTRSLVRASLGDRDGALCSIETLARADPDTARGIGAYLRALFPAWTFWPATDSRRANLAPLRRYLQRGHWLKAASLESFRLAIQKSATRLLRHRARLTEVFGERDWMVPDVSFLLPDGPVEVPVPEDYQGVGIQHLCRQEWTRLVWLCHFAGLDKLALPQELALREDSVPLHIVGIARNFLANAEDPSEVLLDLARKSTIVVEGDIEKVASLARELALQSDWFGLKIADIEASPDASFIQQDEAVFLQTLEFAKGGPVDLFGEQERGEDEEEEESDEEEDGCAECEECQGEEEDGEEPGEDGDEDG
ncbi:MAG: hypothetical protein GYA21_04860 [Myxococcales bacterium]|nr:hypothetical protein [Myxococcales bacterium]